MRETIADYRVVDAWRATTGRYLCHPPERLGRDRDVMVSELAVDAEGWPALLDALIRLAAAGDDRLLEAVEAGPDPATGGAFVVTETAEGGTLAQPENEPDFRSRVAAVEAAARAAHALHEAGLAHGAIHPGTILLTARGAVLDLPRVDAPPGEVVRIGGWSELVTVDPELLSGETPSRSSDIWALGATLHSLLSDRPLFPGIEEDEPVTAVQRIMFTRPEADPALPGPLLELIRKCLAADPADRPRTALALAESLAGAGGTP